MTERLYLHVGAPKSGTTYLQGVLAANRERLAEAGVWVSEDRRDHVHAAMVVREDPRLEHLPDAAAGSWDRLLARVRAWPGEQAIISYELFAGASREQVRRALEPLADLEVHVVITARDLARGVPSAWQERLKFALTVPLEQWAPRPVNAGPRAEWGWRTLDPAGVARRWSTAVPPERVHVVTAPREGDRQLLWQRFAQACDIAHVPVQAPPASANQSLGLAAAEVLRRVNERIQGPLAESNRLQSRWLRDVFAHEVLADLGDEPIGVTAAQLADARERSEQTIEHLAAAGYRVHGDVEDLRATDPQCRTPGDAEDAELLDVALSALARLLERASRADDPADDLATARPPATYQPGLRGRVRQLADAGRGAVVERLERRVDELEAELVRSRALQLRVAELTDLVDELLLGAEPGQLPDARLQTYRDESL